MSSRPALPVEIFGKLLVIKSLRIVNHIQSLFSQTKGCEGNDLLCRAFPDQAVDFAGKLIAFDVASSKVEIRNAPG